jgi:hypothetical protein
MRGIKSKKNYKNKFKTSRQLLETAIRNIWTEMPIDYIQDLYKSISKRRIQDLYKSISKRRKQVIKAEGK